MVVFHYTVLSQVHLPFPPMGLFTILLLLVILGALLFTLSQPKKLRSSHRKLPPGPRGLPVIGCLHMLGNLPHRNLTRLAKKYGPIMFMRLGCVPTVIVSSPQAAKLFLKTHDVVFASRPKLQAFKYLTYGTKGIAFSEYGPYWRNVRKFCTVELLNTAKINSFASMRKEEVGMLVESLKAMAAAGEVVDISTKVAEVIEDMTYQMVFGRNKDGMIDLKTLVREGTRLAGTFNLGDYFPFLGPLDLQGLVQRFKTINKAADELLEKIIDRHIQDGSKDGNHTNFIDIMLSLTSNCDRNKSSYIIDRTNVKAIVLDMLVGGIESSSTTIEWVFSELLRHPRVMRQLQHEIQNVVKMDRMVDESDLENLVYLNMVVKEVLRLHPIGPFLVPHESMEDITIEGHFIPKKSTILINTWAIGRDPNIWSDNVDEFFPGRFMNNNIDLQGRDFELIPFGSGRRGCPGIQLGLKTIRLVLAQLLHCFNWKLPNNMSSNELDMSEKFGLTMPRVNRLYAIPTYRFLI